MGIRPNSPGRKKAATGFFLLDLVATGLRIQYPYTPCEIGCKAAPDQIRDLQPARRLNCLLEDPDHGYDQADQANEPGKCQKIISQIKKDQRPQKIGSQLDPPYGQGLSRSFCPFVDPGHSHSHQNVKNSPYDGK